MPPQKVNVYCFGNDPHAGHITRLFTSIHTPITHTSRWLKKWGIKMGSERQQRKRVKEIAPYPIEADTALFTFKTKSGGEEFCMAAIAYVEDLCHLVESLLEENKRYNSI